MVYNAAGVTISARRASHPLGPPRTRTVAAQCRGRALGRPTPSALFVGARSVGAPALIVARLGSVSRAVGAARVVARGTSRVAWRARACAKTSGAAVYPVVFAVAGVVNLLDFLWTYLSKHTVCAVRAYVGYTHAHTCTHTHTHTHAPAYAHARAHIQTHTHARAHTHACTHAQTKPHPRARTHTGMHLQFYPIINRSPWACLRS